MKARLILPTAAGELVSYEIIGRSGSHGKSLRIVFSTSEEPFERWLFYLMREIGGHVVTDDVSSFREGLGLSDSEGGVVDETTIAGPPLSRHPATA